MLQTARLARRPRHGSHALLRFRMTRRSGQLARPSADASAWRKHRRRVNQASSWGELAWGERRVPAMVRLGDEGGNARLLSEEFRHFRLRNCGVDQPGRKGAASFIEAFVLCLHLLFLCVIENGIVHRSASDELLQKTLANFRHGKLGDRFHSAHRDQPRVVAKSLVDPKTNGKLFLHLFWFFAEFLLLEHLHFFAKFKIVDDHSHKDTHYNQRREEVVGHNIKCNQEGESSSSTMPEIVQNFDPTFLRDDLEHGQQGFWVSSEWETIAIFQGWEQLNAKSRRDHHEK